MDDRNAEFLWENERRYIDSPANAELDGIEPRKVKSQLKNQAASATSLGNTLRTYRGDLERVQTFWEREMADEEGKHYWDDVILPANEDELRRLRNLLDSWLKRAESDFVKREDEILADHLYPLWQDLEIDDQADVHPVRHLFGNFDGSTPGSATTWKVELIARREAVIHLLEEPRLREIFMWVDDHPNSKIPKNKEYKNNDWRWAASRWLSNQHKIIIQPSEFDHVYDLTQRGEVVCEALNKLSNSEASEVADFDTEETLRTWLRLLNRRRSLTD